jgi:ABC-2 type transport system permease protein
MNTQSNARPEAFDSQPVAPPAISEARLFLWSVRRELWEYRSLYLAPLAVAALILIGFAIGTVHLPGKMRAALALDRHVRMQEAIEQPYDFAAMLLMGTYLIIAVFYCLDALYGERRDRSILFWKSLPVSDLTVVLSKACIPILLLPVLIWAITVATQFLMLLLGSMVLAASGQSVAALWSNVPLFSMSLMLLYHLVGMHGLYWAPFYGWMLLVSGWARRAPLVWAILPALAIGVVEKIAFNTSYFARIVEFQFSGGPEKIDYPAGSSMMHQLTLLGVGRFLIGEGLWIGLAIFAAFLFAAVRLRRSQAPI